MSVDLRPSSSGNRFGQVEDPRRLKIFFNSVKMKMLVFKKIRVKKIRYEGSEYGTHFAIQFLSKENYLLGKFENVDEQRVVERNWKKMMNWKKTILEDRTICTLDKDEHIVGISLGISNIDETKNCHHNGRHDCKFPEEWEINCSFRW